MPSLPALRGFEAAVRAGSFSAAARELNVTHAAIAQHVRSLEAHLGQSLLVRDGRQMVPTDAGARLAIDLQEGFSQIIKGVRDLSDDADMQPLQITVTPNFAENWLMPRLMSFWANHPDIRLSINPSNTIIDLRRDGFDMGIRFGNGEWPGLDSTFLVQGDYCVVVHRDLIKGDTPTCMTQLTDVPWLFTSSAPDYKAWAVQSGLDTSKIVEHDIATMSMILSAVRSGAGAAVMILAMVREEIDSGNLVIIEQSAPSNLGYYLVTPKGVLPRKAKTFRKWLLSQKEAD